MSEVIFRNLKKASMALAVILVAGAWLEFMLWLFITQPAIVLSKYPGWWLQASVDTGRWVPVGAASALVFLGVAKMYEALEARAARQSRSKEN
jgi:hypothetical protein